MLVDAKIVNADPEHPLAAYEAGQELEGKAAELQVALGHAQALPELASATAAREEAPAAVPEATQTSEESKVPKGRR